MSEEMTPLARALARIRTLEKALTVLSIRASELLDERDQALARVAELEKRIAEYDPIGMTEKLLASEVERGKLRKALGTVASLDGSYYKFVTQFAQEALAQAKPSDVVAELRKVAEAATPGEWKFHDEERGSGNRLTEIARVTYNTGAEDRLDEQCDLIDACNPADYRFIAAFNPAVALQLLDRMERLERVAEAARTSCKLVYKGAGFDECEGQHPKLLDALAALDAEEKKK